MLEENAFWPNLLDSRTNLDIIFLWRYKVFLHYLHLLVAWLPKWFTNRSTPNVTFYNPTIGIAVRISVGVKTQIHTSTSTNTISNWLLCRAEYLHFPNSMILSPKRFSSNIRRFINRYLHPRILKKTSETAHPLTSIVFPYIHSIADHVDKIFQKKTLEASRTSQINFPTSTYEIASQFKLDSRSSHTFGLPVE